MALSGLIDVPVAQGEQPVRARARRFLAGISSLFALGLAMAPGPATAQLNASIAANRTSGLAPLAVRFDATGSDCSGNGTEGEWSVDLEQCLYSWDFGDPGAPPYEYGAAARAGQLVSANKASGFIAGHVFENPGTYVVTLTIRNPSGQTATRTQTISVSAFSGTTYCVRATSSGSFSGCPSGAVQVTESNFTTALSTCGATAGPRQCLFRRGDSFAAGGGANLANGPGILGAFGSGVRPVVSGTGSGEEGLIRNGNDWRIVELDFVGVGHSGRAHRLFYKSRIRDITTSGVPGLIWWGANLANLYIVRSEIENNTGYYGLYVTAENLVVLGSKIANNGKPGDNKGNARTGDQNRCVWASNTLGPERSNTGHILRLHGENGGASRLVVRDNYVLGNSWASLIIRPQYDTAIESGDDGPINMVLVESNFLDSVVSGSAAGSMLALIVKAQQVSARNNICRLAGSLSTCIAVDSRPQSTYIASDISVVNNSAVWLAGTNSDGSPAFSVQSGLSSIRLVNNLLYHASSFVGPVAGCGGSSCTLASNNVKASINPFVGSSLGDPWQYRLKEASSAVGVGLARPEVIVDFAGTVRSGPRDVGAWALRSSGDPPLPPILLP